MTVLPIADVGSGAIELLGADLLGLARTASVSVVEFDRATAALTEAMSVHVTCAVPERGDDAVRIRELTRMLLVMSTIRDSHVGPGPLSMPPAMLTRSARCLDLAGDATADTELGCALHREATALRSRRIG